MKSDGDERTSAGSRSAQVSVLVPLAIGVLTLVAVIGAAAHSGVRLSDRGPLADQRGPLIVVGGLFLIMDILVIQLIRRILRGRRRLDFERPRFSDDEAMAEPWWVRLLSYLIVVILIALPLVLIYYGLRHRRDGSGDDREASPPAGAPDSVLPESTLSNAAISTMVLLSVAAIVVGAVISYRQLRRPRPGMSVFDPEEPAGDAAEAHVDERVLASAVHAGTAAIKAASGPREAIIACYAAMEATLAEHGSPRRETDTPGELIARAANAGLIRSDASEILTDLFRQARFSGHRMGERDVRAAESALNRLRADLGVTT